MERELEKSVAVAKAILDGIDDLLVRKVLIASINKSKATPAEVAQELALFCWEESTKPSEIFEGVIRNAKYLNLYTNAVNAVHKTFNITPIDTHRMERLLPELGKLADNKLLDLKFSPPIDE